MFGSAQRGRLIFIVALAVTVIITIVAAQHGVERKRVIAEDEARWCFWMDRITALEQDLKTEQFFEAEEMNAELGPTASNALRAKTWRRRLEDRLPTKVELDLRESRRMADNIAADFRTKHGRDPKYTYSRR
jgi:hypothetical protein